MDKKRLMYPHGYVRYVVANANEVREGFTTEQSVIDLYMALVSNAPKIRTKDFLVEVTEVASRLFGSSLANWISDQISNPNVYDSNFDFLMDTVNFVLNGQRRYPVSNWERLVDTRPEPMTLTRHVNEYQSVLTSLKALDAQYIRRWLSNEQGLADLVTTLFIVFGDQPPETDKSRFATWRPAMIL